MCGAAASLHGDLCISRLALLSLANGEVTHQASLSLQRNQCQPQTLVYYEAGKKEVDKKKSTSS